MRQDTILETSLNRHLYRRCKSHIIRTQNITDSIEAGQRRDLVCPLSVELYGVNARFKRYIYFTSWLRVGLANHAILS